MAELQDIFNDPDFKALPPEEKRKAMVELDPDFAALPLAEQRKASFELSGKKGQGIIDKLRATPPLPTLKEIDSSPRLTDEEKQADTQKMLQRMLPMVGGPVANVGGVIRRAVGAATEGAMQGGATEGDPLTGAAMGGATSVGLSLGSKAINALRGVVPPNAIADLAKKFGLEDVISLGELKKSVGWQRTEVLLERAPGFLGTGKFRIAQNEAAHSLAKDRLAQYIADPLAEDIAGANRKYASDLFDTLTEKVKGIPIQQLVPTNTRQVATDFLSGYPAVFKEFQDTRTKQILQNIVKDTQRSTPGRVGSMTKQIAREAPPGGILSPAPGPASTITGNYTVPPTQAVDLITGKPILRTLTFDEAWTLRKGLGEELRRLRKKGDLNQTAESQLSTLYASISKDIDEWTGSISRPDISKLFKDANEAYKTHVVKYDAMQKAYDKAYNEAKDVFSPQLFASELVRIRRANPKLKTFSPEEIKEFKGIASLMHVFKRSGQFMENRPTGDRWGAIDLTTRFLAPVFGGAAGGAAAASGMGPQTLGTLGAGALAIGAAKFLTTTKLGKNLALAASTLEPKSKAMQKIVEQVYKQAPRFVTGATMGMSPLESEAMTVGE